MHLSVLTYKSTAYTDTWYWHLTLKSMLHVVCSLCCGVMLILSTRQTRACLCSNARQEHFVLSASAAALFYTVILQKLYWCIISVQALCFVVLICWIFKVERVWQRPIWSGMGMKMKRQKHQPLKKNKCLTFHIPHGRLFMLHYVTMGIRVQQCTVIATKFIECIFL